MICDIKQILLFFVKCDYVQHGETRTLYLSHPEGALEN